MPPLLEERGRAPHQPSGASVVRAEQWPDLASAFFRDKGGKHEARLSPLRRSSDVAQPFVLWLDLFKTLLLSFLATPSLSLSL